MHLAHKYILYVILANQQKQKECPSISRMERVYTPFPPSQPTILCIQKRRAASSDTSTLLAFEIAHRRRFVDLLMAEGTALVFH